MLYLAQKHLLYRAKEGRLRYGISGKADAEPHPHQGKEICKNVQALLLDGESIVGAYKTVRDQAVFTSHRIFMVDMQGVTGTRQEIFVLPYRKIVHFGIQTAGFGDPLQTSELTVCYADEHEMKFGFIGQEELLAVAQAISRCIL